MSELMDTKEIIITPDLVGMQSYLIMINNFKKESNSKPDGFHYHGFEDFVLENGISFSKVGDINKYDIFGVEERQCFKNAYRATSINKDLIYVEGYAMWKNLLHPTLHAWCVNSQFEILDPTYENPSNVIYLGVMFNYQYMLQTAISRGMYGIIDNMEESYPLMKEKNDNFKYHNK